MKRRTIGEDPLDAVVPMAAPPPAPVVKKEAKPTRAKVAPRPKPEPVPVEQKPVKKERLTVHLPVDVIERAKNAVYWSPGLTLAGLAESAFVRALEKLEKDHGEPFPARSHELKGGRPMK